jgi:hypothetical protein
MHGGAAVLARRGMYVAKRLRHGRFKNTVTEENPSG